MEQVEELGKDKLGRRSIRVGKYTYCLENRMPFDEWLRIKRSMDMNEVFKLHYNDREKLFLRWKWGFEDEKANRELEQSHRAIMYLIEGRYLDDWYWNNVREFEKECFEVKKRLELVKEKKPIDFIVKDAIRKDYE